MAKVSRLLVGCIRIRGRLWTNVHHEPSKRRYFFGSYRIATAPEPNSSPLTRIKSTCYDSPGTTSARAHEPGLHHELVLIDQSSSANARGASHLPHEQSLTRLPPELLTCRPSIRHTSSPRRSAGRRVGLATVPAGGRNAASII